MLGLAAAVDLGTTFTAAAVRRPDGLVEMVTLGSHGFAIPSAVFIPEHGDVVVGDAALDRGRDEPDRLAREFKRRLGDPAPYLLGGAAYSADRLTGELLRWVLDALRRRYGEAPSALVLTHPANWGDYKRDVFDAAIAHAGAVERRLLTEPEAAALHYAAAERVEPGELVAVYDLGGGTFDAAVLERTTTGFAVVVTPKGIERLGGIDLDHVVRGMVTEHLALDVAALDTSDPDTIADLADLHEQCVRAKVALSADATAKVRVRLGDVRADIRLTRGEFEERAAPTLAPTIDALLAAVDAAGVGPDAVARVLLVGGSSRIPLVAAMVSGAIGRPVAVDADPKGAVAMGAATCAEPAVALGTTDRAPPTDPAPPAPPDSDEPAGAGPEALAGAARAPAVAPAALGATAEPAAPPASPPSGPPPAVPSAEPGPPAPASPTAPRATIGPTLGAGGWPALSGAAAALVGGTFHGAPPFVSAGSFTALVVIHAVWLVVLAWLLARAIGWPAARRSGDRRLWAAPVAAGGAWVLVLAKTAAFDAAFHSDPVRWATVAGPVVAGVACGLATGLWREAGTVAAAAGGALGGVVHGIVVVVLVGTDSPELPFVALRLDDLDPGLLAAKVAVTAAVAFVQAVSIVAAVRAAERRRAVA